MQAIEEEPVAVKKPLVARAVVAPPQAKVVFQMLDIQHQGVIQCRGRGSYVRIVIICNY